MVDATIDELHEDEYAMYDDFSNLTEEQLAQLEAASSSALSSTSKSIPHVQVELEGDATSKPHINSYGASISKEPESVAPLQQFRKNNILSVTDLVSPAWCEVQFDYGLRQQRHRKLKDRPSSFVTEQGKEIVVDKGLAAKSDATKKKGVSVHKKLEREIRPEEIKVHITTEEERWGLRIINMIDCIDSLLLLGCAREIPVFGLVEENVVVGIIDEITLSQDSHSSYNHEKKRVLQSSPSTPQKPKRTRRTPSPSQSRITSFMSSAKGSIVETSSVSDPSSALSNHFSSSTLRLIDTKTRRTSSLPSHEDTLPSRLQLMLYHRMLTNLMATSDVFDFSTLWQKLKLDDTAIFSRTFLAQTLLMPETNCLHHLADLWHLAVSRLNGTKIDSTLQVVYRLQPKYPKHRITRNHRDDSVASSREDVELAKAIEASMQDVKLIPKEEQQLTRTLAQSVNDPETSSNLLIGQETNVVYDSDLLWALEQSLLTHLNEAGLRIPERSAQNVQNSPNFDILSKPQSTQSHQTDIIGTKEFEFDSHCLDDYLVDIMKWWNGDRKPRGVSLEQSGRCLSCEYRFGCEWREEKAREVEDRLKLRKQQKHN